MALLKTLLIHKLEMENVNLTNVDLDEIMEIYDHIMSFIFEDINTEYEGNKEDPRYSFLFKATKSYNATDKRCLDNIKRLIKIKEHNLLYLIDYSLLTHLCVDYRNNFRIKQLNNFLSEIDKMYKRNKENFYLAFIDRYRSIIHSFCNYDRISTLENSKYVPKEYASIFRLYKDIFVSYYKNGYHDIEFSNRLNYNVDFYDLVNLSFYYFLFNGLLLNDSENVYNFLKYLYLNVIEIIDTINMSGANTKENLYNYIDIMYKNGINNTVQIR